MATSIVRVYNVKGEFTGYAVYQSTSDVLLDSFPTIEEAIDDEWDEETKEMLRKDYPDSKHMNNAIRCPKCKLGHLCRVDESDDEGLSYLSYTGWVCYNCGKVVPDSDVSVDTDGRWSP